MYTCYIIYLYIYILLFFTYVYVDRCVSTPCFRTQFLPLKAPFQRKVPVAEALNFIEEILGSYRENGGEKPWDGGPLGRA